MPTVIILDVSLSMCRTVKQFTNKDANSTDDAIELRQLANVGIGTLLDYFAQNAQLEYTSLIIFSSLWEIKHQFTRHHESIKDGIYDLEIYDKSNVVNAVRGALSLKLNEWSKNGPVNLILITDGQVHCENANSHAANDEDDEQDFHHDDFLDIPLSELENQFDFPCKVQVVCLNSPNDPGLAQSLPFYKNLVLLVDKSAVDCPVFKGTNLKNFKQSAIWLPQPKTIDISIKSVEKLFLQIAESHYKPHHSVLLCGHLSSMIMLTPKPTECIVEPLKNEYDDLKNEESSQAKPSETFVSASCKTRRYKLNDRISICGFMPMSEIASPAVKSKHLVLPAPHENFNETIKAERVFTRDPQAYSGTVQSLVIDEPMEVDQAPIGTFFKAPELSNQLNKSSTRSMTITSPRIKELPASESDLTKQPSFCILLTICLKLENMVAICIVGSSDNPNDDDDWYGMIDSHTDKKRSSLMLSLFTPGQNPIPWLPSIKTLGSLALEPDSPPSIRERMANTRNTTKSYSSNSVIWLDQESVQADVQKIVRHAKRAPEKAPHFYKELNRIRRAAISYGFYDVLFGLVSILEREKRIMRLDQGKNQETLRHFDHVIACLREDLNWTSYETNITPVT